MSYVSLVEKHNTRNDIQRNKCRSKYQCARFRMFNWHLLDKTQSRIPIQIGPTQTFTISHFKCRTIELSITECGLNFFSFSKDLTLPLWKYASMRCVYIHYDIEKSAWNLVPTEVRSWLVLQFNWISAKICITSMTIRKATKRIKNSWWKRMVDLLSSISNAWHPLLLLYYRE